MTDTPNRGARVRTLAMLYAASLGRRSVVVPGARNFEAPTPAAFMINLPGVRLLHLFSRGMYLYRKDGD